jgi:hypothetical protein
VNEQEAADLFSKQLDRLLAGEPITADLADDEALRGRLSLADDLSGVGFQASSSAQAAFQNQLETWFGPANAWTTPKPSYRRWNTMPAKILALIVSVLVTITIGAVALVISVLVVIRSFIPGMAPGTPTPTLTATPPLTATSTPISSTTSTPLPSLTSTAVPTGTLTATPMLSPTMPGEVDTIDAITVVITIEIEIDDLVPGLVPGDDGDHDDGGGGGGNCPGCGDDYSDHNRGHGNDPDHHDEDNPGRGGH